MHSSSTFNLLLGNETTMHDLAGWFGKNSLNTLFTTPAYPGSETKSNTLRTCDSDDPDVSRTVCKLRIAFLACCSRSSGSSLLASVPTHPLLKSSLLEGSVTYPGEINGNPFSTPTSFQVICFMGQLLGRLLSVLPGVICINLGILTWVY